MSDSASGAGAPRVFAKYLFRFGVLSLYALSNATNAFLWICFAPISSQVEERYGVGALAVNMLSLSFSFLYLPGTVLALYLMERWGLRVSLC